MPGRGSPRLLIELQDRHGQSAAFLLWRLWRLEDSPSDTLLARAVAIARSAEARVIQPLRRARRALDRPPETIGQADGWALRADIGRTELAAERWLLRALAGLDEGAATDADPDPLAALRQATAIFGGAPPVALLAALVSRAGALDNSAVSVSKNAGADRANGPLHMGDEAAGGQTEAEIRRELADLRQQHQDLDAAVHALEIGPDPDQLRIARLKKQKLLLRDRIATLDDRLTPDIIA